MNDMAEVKEKAARTTVSMPEEMMSRAQDRVRGNFPTFSAYVQDLIRRDLGVKPGAERKEEAKAA